MKYDLNISICVERKLSIASKWSYLTLSHTSYLEIFAVLDTKYTLICKANVIFLNKKVIVCDLE